MKGDRPVADAMLATLAAAELAVWAGTGVDIAGWTDLSSFAPESAEERAARQAELARLARAQRMKEVATEAYMASRDAAADRNRTEWVLLQDPLTQDPVALALRTGRTMETKDDRD